ncbi:hypothetical protein D3C76_1176920 [compost metagenome]
MIFLLIRSSCAIRPSGYLLMAWVAPGHCWKARRVTILHCGARCRSWAGRLLLSPRPMVVSVCRHWSCAFWPKRRVVRWHRFLSVLRYCMPVPRCSNSPIARLHRRCWVSWRRVKKPPASRSPSAARQPGPNGPRHASSQESSVAIKPWLLMHRWRMCLSFRRAPMKTARIGGGGWSTLRRRG